MTPETYCIALLSHDVRNFSHIHHFDNSSTIQDNSVLQWPGTKCCALKLMEWQEQDGDGIQILIY